MTCGHAERQQRGRVRVQPPSLPPATVAPLCFFSANFFSVPTMLQWNHQRSCRRLPGTKSNFPTMLFGGCLPSQRPLARGGPVLGSLQLLATAGGVRDQVCSSSSHVLGMPSGCGDALRSLNDPGPRGRQGSPPAV